MVQAWVAVSDGGDARHDAPVQAAEVEGEEAAAAGKVAVAAADADETAVVVAAAVDGCAG